MAEYPLHVALVCIRRGTHLGHSAHYPAAFTFPALLSRTVPPSFPSPVTPFRVVPPNLAALISTPTQAFTITCLRLVIRSRYRKSSSGKVHLPERQESQEFLKSELFRIVHLERCSQSGDLCLCPAVSQYRCPAFLAAHAGLYRDSGPFCWQCALVTERRTPGHLGQALPASASLLMEVSLL